MSRPLCTAFERRGEALAPKVIQSDQPLSLLGLSRQSR
jgi:hypothetical protein